LQVKATIVEEYIEVRRNGAVALVCSSCAEVAAAALIEGKGCVPSGSEGRGTVFRFSYPGGQGIVRRYLRGGFMRHFLKDAYFISNRPLREFRLHQYAIEQGLAVPPLLGVCWRRRGLFVHGAIATQALDAVPLDEYLRRGTEETGAELRACGALIRRMHDREIWHADLHVRNILIGHGGPYLIDFDKAVRRSGLTRLQRARNLLRLRRSLEKNGLSLAFFQPLCEGYGVEALPEWLSRIYRSKGYLSDRISGRRGG